MVASKLEFTHFVVATSERKIFASGTHNGRVENFIIDIEAGQVQYQVADRFEFLSDELAEQIRIRASIQYGKVPVYKVRTLDFS